MEKDELITLIENIHARKYESRDIELKSGKEGNPRKFYDTLSSFSNTEGGILIFGIDEKDDYEVCGLKDIAGMQKTVQEVSKDMEPIVRPIITPIEYREGIHVLVVEVKEMDYLEKPCYYRPLGISKGSFVRTGDGDEPMTEFEIFQFQAFKRQTKTELETFDDFTFEHNIDSLKLDAYLAKAVENKPNFANLPKDTVLEMLGLARSNKPTLVCLLLFGKYPQEVSPMLTINCVKVNGNDYMSQDTISERFLANESIGGTISQMFTHAYRFILANIKTTTVIDDDGTRKDRSEYPLIAIRELLMNALIHRDYGTVARSIPISVTIYANRIEIVNPGSILGNYKVEDLGKEYLPVRNMFLCRNAEDLLATENRHSGILAAIEGMKKHRLFPPLFESNRGFFKVTLYNRDTSEYKNAEFVEDILRYCYLPRSKESLAAHFGFSESKSTYFYNAYIKPLVESGVLYLTMPERPNSKFQRITSNPKEAK